MNDAGNPIQVDIQSAIISCFEQAQGAIRYNLGYISGEFSKNITADDLYVKIWFQRGLNMAWQSIQYRLNPGRKIFRQKLPAGLTVASFYVQLYGWIAAEEGDPDLTAEFELTDFELSVKEIPMGKFAGEPLGLDTSSEPPPPPVVEPFEMHLDIIGEVQATQARAVWFTTHDATTKVIYGLSPLEMYNEVEDLTFTPYHSIIMTGLEVNRLYYAQFYSTSKITGETIYSDVKTFYTGPELTITCFLENPDVDFEAKIKQEFEIANILGETEHLLTLLPDAEDGTILNVDFSILTKVELAVTNIIGNDFDTLVS